jgi:hypothetical protein
MCFPIYTTGSGGNKMEAVVNTLIICFIKSTEFDMMSNYHLLTEDSASQSYI